MPIWLWFDKFIESPIWSGIASILTIVGIVFAAIYWWVLQRQDVRQKRWEQYQKVFELVWNLSNDVPSGLQVAAAYQLVEFKEFAYATVCALEAALSKSSNQPWYQILGVHLVPVAALLRETAEYTRQKRKFRK